MSVAAWSQHRSPSPSPSPQRRFGHFRSLSSIAQPSSPSPRPRSPTKSQSSSNVTADMGIGAEPKRVSTPQPKRMTSTASLMDDQEHNTIPDPRNRALSPSDANSPSSPMHHPDLDQEVAALSTKLINAINHQTTLDDTLSVTRQELEASRSQVKDLEALVARQQETLTGDVWVKRSSVEAEKHKLLQRIVEEKKLRNDVEKEKKKIEQELETLTVSLFEEANKMVISAKEESKKEQDAISKKNEQLRAQLADQESLFRSQQEQLSELKLVMEQMTAAQDDRSGTAPSSPGFSRFDPKEVETRLSEGPNLEDTPGIFSPTYSTSLNHLIQPVLRSDISAFEDFVALAKTSKQQPTSRASSGSFSGLNPILGLSGAGAAPPSNASTASLSTTGTPSSNGSPLTPNTPASLMAVPSGASTVPLPPLKETKFYKRVLAEDIEPTLRLDTAPGLSWLARRSVITAMTEGSLVVEPVPTNSPFASISRPEYYPCSLCGESRKDKTHARNHRFRTSEVDSAQRYPLCGYCLGRVRSTCDFLGFLRMVKDGHWRAEDSDAEKTAWEESVKLREQMFWSRIGGGVVPSHAAHAHTGSTGGLSVRNSHEVTRSSLEQGGSASHVQAEGMPVEVEQSTPEKLPDSDVQHFGDNVDSDLSKSTEKESHTEADAQMVTPPETPITPERLSITIPGAFT